MAPSKAAIRVMLQMRFTGSPWTIEFQAEVYNRRSRGRDGARAWRLFLGGGRQRHSGYLLLCRRFRRRSWCWLALIVHPLVTHNDRDSAVGWAGGVVFEKQAL